jgi:uncharacterized membrane protein YqgA involved in biofilm formation
LTCGLSGLTACYQTPRRPPAGRREKRLETTRPRAFPCRVFGTWANVAMIIAGGVAGLSLRRDLSPRRQMLLKYALGAAAIYLGFHMVWTSIGGRLPRVLLQLGIGLFALILGNLVGKAAGLQREVNRLGRHARERFVEAQKKRRADLADGLVACSILFCMGPLAIPGALQEGLQGDPRPLLLKAAMDGLGAIALARVLGVGALLAAGPVLIYQGSLTWIAQIIRPRMAHPDMIDGFTLVAGLMVAMSALIIFDVRKVPLADYLPALVFAPALWMFFR